jgi:hypothetical protein
MRNRDRGSLTAPPLPHHRTYGSVSGGWVDHARRCAATEAKPSEPKELFGSALVSAGLFASRQGPCGLPAVCAAWSRPTPRRRSSAKRAGPRFHCFQAMAQPPPEPPIKFTQHRRRLAEAEVAAPPDEVDGQLLDDLHEAFSARAPRQLPNLRLEAGYRLRRNATPRLCPAGEAEAQETCGRLVWRPRSSLC